MKKKRRKETLFQHAPGLMILIQGLRKGHDFVIMKGGAIIASCVDRNHAPKVKDHVGMIDLGPDFFSSSVRGYRVVDSIRHLELIRPVYLRKAHREYVPRKSFAIMDDRSTWSIGSMRADGWRECETFEKFHSSFLNSGKDASFCVGSLTRPLVSRDVFEEICSIIKLHGPTTRTK